MQTVDVFIETSLRGSAKGTGRVMYIMRAELKSGIEHESRPEAAEYDRATESSLVLYALRDALGRLNYPCRVVVHTECIHVADAIGQHWPEGWQKNGWKTGKGKEARNAVLWDMVLHELEEQGHGLYAEWGKHEYTHWMRWNLPLARAGIKRTPTAMDARMCRIMQATYLSNILYQI